MVENLDILEILYIYINNMNDDYMPTLFHETVENY